MRVGDKVRATTDIHGLLRPSVPKGSVGAVSRVGNRGIEVTFTVPGLMGGTRTIVTAVRPSEIVKL